MTVLEWLVVLIYLVLVAVGKTGFSALSLIGMVLAMIVLKMLIEPLPEWIARRKNPS